MMMQLKRRNAALSFSVRFHEELERILDSGSSNNGASNGEESSNEDTAVRLQRVELECRTARDPKFRKG
jgi:hypothetical protein